ncbi:hypothetical protein AURANDRAFT_11462, partial [Aureococcus anophagefferens]
EFEDSKEGGEPYQFLVGGGGAVKGLSDAVRRMRRGEVAYVWMAGHKGLGEEGNPPKIPKHAALCFELELLKFTDGKDVSPEMDGSVLTRRVTKGASRPRGFLSPHDKSTITFDFELWTDDEKNDWVKAAPSTSWRLDEDDCGTPTGSYDDSEPYKPLCRGIDIAVRSMKMGERATVYIDRRYGYDDRDPHVEDCVPNCAKNVDLVATLEIHNLERLPEMWEIRNRAKLDHCDEFKKMGNRRYAAGDYARAIRRYDRAVETGSSDTYVTDDELKELRGKKVGVLLNRAAAHMKLKNYLLCRNDAREVLNRDPDSLKALFRMGHASMHLDNLDDARGALEKVLVLDPENRRARLDLELVDEKEQRARRKEK